MAAEAPRSVVLFASVTGSVRLWERLSDEEAGHAVERCLKRMERVVEGLGGQLLKSGRDELMAGFVDADTAFHAGVEMLQRVQDLPPVSGIKLGLRVGFHLGPRADPVDTMATDTVGVAARLAGMAKGGQILTSATTVAALSPIYRQASRVADRVPLRDDGEVLEVWEVLWQVSAELGMPPVPEAPGTAAAVQATPPLSDAAPGGAGASLAGRRFCLRYRGRAYLLDDKSELLTFGRDAGCDVVVEDRRASRRHARIERRPEGCVLIDASTNGTYVTLDGERERFIRHAAFPLDHGGRLTFGHNDDGVVDVAEFEYL